MNDGGYQGFNEQRFQNYLRGLQGMADQARKANVRVAWVTPQPIERREPGPQLTGYNETLEKFSADVKEIAAKNGGLRVDEALPFFPEEARSILTWAPVLDELNDYRLKVSRLNPGRYDVRLGGKKVATYSAEELAAGVNLAEAALKAGPVADQVKAAWKAV